MNWLAENMLGLIGTLAMSGGVYAALRADLAAMHERISSQKETIEYHQDRIDRLERRARHDSL